MTRAAFFFFLAASLALVGCGGGGNPSSSNAPTSKIAQRVFVSNQSSNLLNIIDAKLMQGTTFSVTVGAGPTRMLESPDKSTTVVLSSLGPAVDIVNNVTEAQSAAIPLPSAASDLVLASDGNRLYVAVPNASCVGSAVVGEVAVFSVAASKAVQCVSLAAARFLALSHDGKTLLVFAQDSNVANFVDTTSFTVTAVNDPSGILDRPVGAVFSSDDSTALVLNCGVECGGAVTSAGTDASVTAWTRASNSLGSTLGVAAAREALLDSGNLYVAGTDPVAGGTLSVVNAGALTLSKQAAIADGTHDRILLANGQLFIGARACSDTAHGCLSIFNTNSGQVLFSATNPNGGNATPAGDDVTGIEAIPNSNSVYVCEGGELRIYSTPADVLGLTQIDIVGNAVDVKEVF